MKINMVLFLIPIAVIFGIAILIISVQTIKAALTNPVNSLRSE